jgi:hypothetical protein
MHVSIAEDLSAVRPDDWNLIAGSDNPFIRYEFLRALEQTRCVGADAGWLPRHILLHDKAPGAGALLGAVPLYLKTHSFGEYVFDWSWAHAYERAGLAYYPKLVATVPFTPVTGPRLLVANGGDRDDVRRALIEGAHELARRYRVSSLHWLFTTEADTRALESARMMRRVGCQFHWTNRGYRDFADYLDTFTSAKRNKIKRERRYVREAGIELETRSGADMTDALWQTLYKFYHSTVQLHGASAYLTRAFFHELGSTLPDSVRVTLARQGTEYIAGALNLRGRNSLFGRYWGCSKALHSLHFETCFYTPIEYCIAEGIERFEAGAQGEHKLTRGFAPTPTYSAHWLSHARFNDAVGDFLARERDGMEYYMDELNEHLPFKQPAA